MGDKMLRIHQFLPYSRANGPGMRAVIWVQGCSLACPGCFNPATHPPDGGQPVPIAELFARITDLGDAIEGITISGGEPLQQGVPLQMLLQRVRQETGLSIVLFTGYSWEEVQRLAGAGPLLGNVDVLIAGQYRASQRLARGLRGSANQTVHLLTGRYTLADVQAVPAAEILIAPGGEILLSGVDPLRWENLTA